MIDPSDWVGRTETIADDITAWRRSALAATIGAAAPALSEPLILPDHWLFTATVSDAVGDDGHPPRGDFMPPIPARRRMFAAATMRALQPLVTGDPITRTSRITAVTTKPGRTGPLTFVTVGTAIATASGVAVEEEQTIVYTDALPGEPPPGPGAVPDAPWQDEVATDPVLLFRFSALTFNAHRIHYDLDYATHREGYPHLVVQGPLQAVLLSRLGHRVLGHPPTRFSFRSVTPIWCGETIHLRAWPDGDGARLQALADDGRIATEATIG